MDSKSYSIRYIFLIKIRGGLIIKGEGRKRDILNRHRPYKRKKKRKNSKESAAGRANHMRGNTFERDMVKAYNVFFRERKIKGFAYRLKQYKYTSQLIDILVDSPFQEYYQAVECKSVKMTRGRCNINFGSYFSEGQLEHEYRFIDLTGRRGVLAIELRHQPDSYIEKRGIRGGLRGWKEAYLVPFEYVWDVYLSGAKSLSVDEIRTFPNIKREKSLYRL